MLRSTTVLSLLLALACSGSSTTESPSTPASELPEPPSAESPEPPSVEIPEPPSAEIPEPPSAEIPEPPDAEAAANPPAGPVNEHAGQRPPWRIRTPCAVPQPVDTAGLYRLAVSAPPKLEDGLLLCSISMSETPPKGRKWDLFGNPPDPSATLWIGEEKLGSACASDKMSTTLSWPGVSLSTGDKMKLSVTDMDVNNDDFAGMDLLLFEGRLPVDLNGEHFSATCRMLSPDDVNAQLAPQVQSAILQLRRTGQMLVPLPEAVHFGYPVEQDEQARRSIENVAGYVGWEGEVLDPLLEKYASMQDAWMRAVSRSIAVEYDTCPERIEIVSGVSLSVTGHQCPRACVLEVTVTNSSKTPATLDLTGDVTRTGPFWAVLPNGRDLWLQIESPSEARHEPLILDAGESVVLQLSEFLPGTDPAISAVGAEGVSLVRLIWNGQHLLIPVPD